MTWLLKLREQRRPGSKYGVEEFLQVKYLCMGGIDRSLLSGDGIDCFVAWRLLAMTSQLAIARTPDGRSAGVFGGRSNLLQIASAETQKSLSSLDRCAIPCGA